MADQTRPGPVDEPLATAPRRQVDVTSKRFGELSTDELYELLRLRCDVFVVEQACPYPDLDGRDTEPGTVHHWIADATGSPDRPVIAAYLRAVAEPDGSTRIGRVVTAPWARGRGLAAGLVEHVGEAIAGPIVLAAQSHLTDWYRRVGYAVAGDEFVEDGIPHVPMRRPPRAR